MEQETKAEPAPPTPPAESFVCPVCNAPVEADAASCPSCGAQFVEGEATEFECPVCKASVAADADQCPSCGVRFASEEEEPPPAAAPTEPTPPDERNIPATPPSPPALQRPELPSRMGISLSTRLAAIREAKSEAPAEAFAGDQKLMYRELPRLVNEVKSLLLSAKRIGLEIDEQKGLINDAIAAGKRRDIERAVRLIGEARHGLNLAFTEYISTRMDAFLAELNRANHGDDATYENLLEECVTQLEAGNYDLAWERLQGATTAFQARAKEYHEARDGLTEEERLVAEARDYGMNVQDLEKLLRQGRDAMARRDEAGALRAAKQVRERLARDLPGFIQEEMRKARNILLDLKVRGGDLSKPIGILKVASVHVKKEEWTEAMRYLEEFHRAMETV